MSEIFTHKQWFWRPRVNRHPTFTTVMWFNVYMSFEGGNRVRHSNRRK